MRDRCWNRHGYIGPVINYAIEDGKVVARLQAGLKISSSPDHPEKHWNTASLLHSWHTGLLHPDVQRPARETDNSPPYNADDYENMKLRPHSRYAFMTWNLKKQRNKFSFSVRGLRDVPR